MSTTNTKPDDVAGPPTFSPEAMEMLHAMGKNDLREVAESEWLLYATRLGMTGRELLAAEYWNWHLPDVEFLELIHGKDARAAAIQHWSSVQNRTADLHVQAHAASQIKLLEHQSNEEDKQP